MCIIVVFSGRGRVVGTYVSVRKIMGSMVGEIFSSIQVWGVSRLSIIKTALFNSITILIVEKPYSMLRHVRGLVCHCSTVDLDTILCKTKHFICILL